MQDIGPGASTLDERSSQFVDRLAQTAMLAGPASRTPKAELQLLKDALAQALRAGD